MEMAKRAGKEKRTRGRARRGRGACREPGAEVRVCNFATGGRTWPNGAFLLYAHEITRENRDDRTCSVQGKAIVAIQPHLNVKMFRR